MRGVLIDYVRSRRAQKRGGAFEITSLPTELPERNGTDAGLEDIGEALPALESVEPRLAQLIDLKFFCGFSFGESGSCSASPSAPRSAIGTRHGFCSGTSGTGTRINPTRSAAETALEAAWHRRAAGCGRRCPVTLDEALETTEETERHGKAGAQFLPILFTRRAEIELAAAQLASAGTDARQALALLTTTARPGDYSVYAGRAELTLARVLAAGGQSREARGAANRAVEQLAKAEGANHPEKRAALRLSGGPALGEKIQ